MRLLAIAAAAITLAACVTPARAGSPPVTRYGAEMYLRGYVDAGTPAGWYATRVVCEAAGRGWACEAEATFGPTGKRECWLVAMPHVPKIVAPFQQVRCGKKPPSS